MNLSLKEQLDKITNETFPFIRHDRKVRGRIIAEMGDNMLVATIYPNSNPVRRVVTREYWESNYWEGVE
jgi:hypothetical protein